MIYSEYLKNITIKQRGTVTLPKKIRDALDLYEGKTVRVFEQDGAVVLQPVENIDAQLAIDIREGLEDIKKGNFIEFGSVEELHEKLGVHED